MSSKQKLKLLDSHPDIKACDNCHPKCDIYFVKIGGKTIMEDTFTDIEEACRHIISQFTGFYAVAEALMGDIE